MIKVDSNKQGIVFLGDQKFRELRIDAEKRRQLFHFCSLQTLREIIKTKSLMLNNLSNFKGIAQYEKEGISADFLGLVFISCLSHCSEDKNLWEEFGDEGKGVKIIFGCDGILHDEIFNKNERVKAISTTGQIIGEFGFNVSSIIQDKLCCKANFSTDIIVDLILTDVLYSKHTTEATINMEEGRWLNLSNISRTVLTKFIDEEETRVIGVLRSTKEVCMDNILHLLLPLDFEKIQVEFGAKVNEEDKRDITDRINYIRQN